MSVVQKIEALRESMKKHQIAAVIIPSNDPHQSEYVADRWKYREWISGFTGSAGTVVVGLQSAGLWTDGRYYLQGEQELQGTGITLHKTSDPHYLDWLIATLPSGSHVAIDGDVCSIGQLEKLERRLSPSNIQVNTKLNLVGDVWEDQPSIPEGEIFTHDVKYAGESRTDKLERIREEMRKQGADLHLISTLDDLAWIFNIRGADVEFNPVTVAYALIGHEFATLYILPHKVPAAIADELKQQGIACKDYHDVLKDLNELPPSATILLDPANCSVKHYKGINAQKRRGSTIARAMKAIKNPTEIDHSKQVMVKDGVAIAHTFYWLEQQLQQGNTCTEADFADKLAFHRSQQEHYIGESFPAIIGYRANGAIIHYRPQHGSAAEIKADGMLLADSGGQYLDGTTDITRTVALGTPTEEEKLHYTLVLKGHIELAKARFPAGTTGGQLDILARMHLWARGLNYAHGTGHGVGFFLNVHEPPQGFAPPPSERATTKQLLGMLSSNEPGYYLEGAYGIRIENLMYTVQSEIEGYYEFENITLYPIDIRLIEESIFTKGEKAWLNRYHQEVYKKISPYLDGDIKTWFELKCRGMN